MMFLPETVLACLGSGNWVVPERLLAGHFFLQSVHLTLQPRDLPTQLVKGVALYPQSCSDIRGWQPVPGGMRQLVIQEAHSGIAKLTMHDPI